MTTTAPSPSKPAKATATTASASAPPPPPSTPRSGSGSSSSSTFSKRITSPLRKTPTSSKPKPKRTSTTSTTSTTTTSTDQDTTNPTPPPLLPPSTLFRTLSTLLAESCDPNPQPAYAAHLARYLRGDLSKCEFQSFVLAALPAHAIAVHNNLILSLLRSVLTVPPPPPPPPPLPTTPPRPSSSSPPPPANIDQLLSPGLSLIDFASHPLPYPRTRRATHEPTDARRTRTRREAVALPKDDRDRLRRELMAMDPEAAAAASGDGADEGGAAAAAGKKKKKSKRAAAAAAAALAATLSGEGLTPNASAATAPNPFTHPTTTVTSMGPGLELFGDPPLAGYAYPPTPPHSSSGSSPDTGNALPLVATSRARHAEYMRLVHNMHICRVQGDLPAVPQLHDRMTCVLWEVPGGKVDKVGPGAVELMMFGLRTYLKEVVEGMVRVARVGEREEEVLREVGEHVQSQAQDEERGQAEDEQDAEQPHVKMDVDDKDEDKDDDKASVSAAALALLNAAPDGQVQSWSARSAPPASPPAETRQRSTSTSAGNGTVQAPWAGKSIRRPNSFTAPPASAPIAPPLDSPTSSSSASLVRTHSSRSVASNPPAAPVSPPRARAVPAHTADTDVLPRAPAPLAPRDRVLTLNHLATALALEPVLAGDARHVADRVLARLWHATPEDEEVARWRGEMRRRVRAREDEAAGGAVSE